MVITHKIRGFENDLKNCVINSLNDWNTIIASIPNIVLNSGNVLSADKKIDKDKYNDYKELLPGFYLDDRVDRSIKTIKQFDNLYQLDIDGFDTEIDAIDFFNDFKTFKYVKFCFLSPSRYGVKAIINIKDLYNRPISEFSKHWRSNAFYNTIGNSILEEFISLYPKYKGNEIIKQDICISGSKGCFLYKTNYIHFNNIQVFYTLDFNLAIKKYELALKLKKEEENRKRKEEKSKNNDNDFNNAIDNKVYNTSNVFEYLYEKTISKLDENGYNITAINEINKNTTPFCKYYFINANHFNVSFEDAWSFLFKKNIFDKNYLRTKYDNCIKLYNQYPSMNYTFKETINENPKKFDEKITLTNTQYISDITDTIYDILEEHKRVKMIAAPGLGKTHLIKELKNKYDRIIVVSSLNAIVNQMENTLSDGNTNFYYDKNKYNPETASNDDKDYIVCNPEKLDDIVLSKYNSNYVLIVDEYHNIITSANYRDKFYNLYDNLDLFEKILFMSATDPIDCLPILETTYKLNVVKKKKDNQNITFIKYKYNSRDKKEFQNFIYNEYKDYQKIILYKDTNEIHISNLIMDYQEFDSNFSPLIVNSNKKGDKTIKDILLNEELFEDIVATNYIGEGVNITKSKPNIVLICEDNNFDLDELIQMSNRFRNAENIVIIFKYSSESNNKGFIDVKKSMKTVLNAASKLKDNNDPTISVYQENLIRRNIFECLEENYIDISYKTNNDFLKYLIHSNKLEEYLNSYNISLENKEHISVKNAIRTEEKLKELEDLEKNFNNKLENEKIKLKEKYNLLNNKKDTIKEINELKNTIKDLENENKKLRLIISDLRIKKKEITSIRKLYRTDEENEKLVNYINKIKDLENKIKENIETKKNNQIDKKEKIETKKNINTEKNDKDKEIKNVKTEKIEIKELKNTLDNELYEKEDKDKKEFKRQRNNDLKKELSKFFNILYTSRLNMTEKEIYEMINELRISYNNQKNEINYGFLFFKYYDKITTFLNNFHFFLVEFDKNYSNHMNIHELFEFFNHYLKKHLCRNDIFIILEERIIEELKSKNIFIDNDLDKDIRTFVKSKIKINKSYKCDELLKIFEDVKNIIRKSTYSKNVYIQTLKNKIFKNHISFLSKFFNMKKTKQKLSGLDNHVYLIIDESFFGYIFSYNKNIKNKSFFTNLNTLDINIINNVIDTSKKNFYINEENKINVIIDEDLKKYFF